MLEVDTDSLEEPCPLDAGRPVPRAEGELVLDPDAVGFRHEYDHVADDGEEVTGPEGRPPPLSAVANCEDGGPVPNRPDEGPNIEGKGETRPFLRYPKLEIE